MEGTEDGGGEEEEPREKMLALKFLKTSELLKRFDIRPQRLPLHLRLIFTKIGTNVPLKSAKHNGGNHAIAHIPITQYQIAMEHRQRNEPSEPEQHAQGVKSQNGEFVRETREGGGREREIGDCDDHGPDRTEEKEANGVRGVVYAGVAIVPVCD